MAFLFSFLFGIGTDDKNRGGNGTAKTRPDGEILD